MNKLVRGLVAGSVIGAAVGVAMLMGRKRGMINAVNNANMFNQRARGAVRMVRDNTMRWTSALKNGTEAVSRRLAHRGI